MKTLTAKIFEALYDVSSILKDNIKDMLSPEEQKLLLKKQLVLVIKNHTNRKIDDIQGYSGQYTNLKEVPTKFYNAVITMYERGCKVNRSAAHVREVKPKEEIYTPYYDPKEEHHVLKCIEVYNYQGSYMRVCLEAVYNTEDLKNADKTYQDAETLKLEAGDLISWSDNYSDLYIGIVEDVKGPVAYMKGKYVWVQQGRDYAGMYDQELKIFKKFQKLHGSMTIDEDYSKHTYQIFKPVLPVKWDSDVFKKLENIKVNDKQDKLVFRKCLNNWLNYAQDKDEKLRQAVIKTNKLL